MDVLRNELYTSWLKGKTIRDKALQYMDELDPERAKSTESLIEVAISLSAVDRIIGEGISQEERSKIKKKLKDFRESCDCGIPCKHCGDNPQIKPNSNNPESEVKPSSEGDIENEEEVNWLNVKEEASVDNHKPISPPYKPVHKEILIVDEKKSPEKIISPPVNKPVHKETPNDYKPTSPVKPVQNDVPEEKSPRRQKPVVRHETVNSSTSPSVPKTSPPTYSHKPTTVQVVPTEAVEVPRHEAPTKTVPLEPSLHRTGDFEMQTDEIGTQYLSNSPRSLPKRSAPSSRVMLDQSVQFEGGLKFDDTMVLPYNQSSEDLKPKMDMNNTKPFDGTDDLLKGKEREESMKRKTDHNPLRDSDLSQRPPFVVKHICTCLHPCVDACKKKRPASPTRATSPTKLNTIPLDIDARPVFVVRHVCQCVAKGCTDCLCQKEEEVLPEEPEPVKPPPPVVVVPPKRNDMRNHSSQTEEVQTSEFGIQSLMPSSDMGTQHQPLTSQQEVQVEVESEEKLTQTERMVKDVNQEPDTVLLRDQGCQTVQAKDKPRFAVRNVCMCALKDTCVGCCDTSDRPRKNYVNPVFLRKKPSPPDEGLANFKHSCPRCANKFDLNKVKSQKANEALFRPPFKVQSACQHCGSCEDCKATYTSSKSENKEGGARKPATMKSVWMKWVMCHYTLNNITLRDEDIDKFSGATKEYLISERDLRSHDPNFSSIMDTLNSNKNILPSLKYFMSNSSKRDGKSDGLKKMELTPDQRLQNKIFIRECSKLWFKANANLNSIIIGHVVSMKNQGISTIRKNETKKYYELSLKRLRDWKEIDDDKREKEEKDSWKEKKYEAQKQFEGYVKKKDSVRIRIPDSLTKDSSQIWQDDSEITSVMIMAGQGMKYVHATHDFEKSKKQLVNLGISKNEKTLILKENFEQENVDKYWLLLKQLKEKYKEIEEERRKKEEKSFNEFIVLTEIRERALRCLQVMPKPVMRSYEVSKPGGDNNDSSETSPPFAVRHICTCLHRCVDACKKRPARPAVQSHEVNRPGIENKNKNYYYYKSGDISESPEISLCIAVGKALKGIDRTLCFEWMEWCKFIFSSDVARTLWDYFSPRSCDVHTSSTLAEKCVWGNTCRVTGLTNAYSVFIPSKRFLRSNVAKMMGMDKPKTSSDDVQNLDFTSLTGKLVIRDVNGSKTAFMESTERKQRFEILRKLGLFFSADEEVLNPFFVNKAANNENNLVNRCQHSNWTFEMRQRNMQFLTDISREAFKERYLEKLMKEGDPPHAPKLSTIDPLDPTQSENSMLSQLMLVWKKGEESDLVSFYSLEFGGKVGMHTNDVAYKEVCRDPPDADPDHQMQMKHLMKGLLPGCSYYFRIRALNGYGSSNYTYRIFTTNASAPMQPTVLKLSSDSVTLSWGITKKFYKRYKMLKNIFDLAKIDHNGMSDLTEKVKKENLIRVINEKVLESHDLKNYVIKVARSAAIDTSNGFRALFDLLDVDEEGKISWEQFELFLISNNVNVTTTASQLQLQGQGSLKSDTSTSSISAMIQTTSGDIRYVVERCVLDGDNETNYEEVLRTDSTEVTIKHLSPGCSYRFRVYSISKSGIPGPKSQSVIIHTYLMTPVTPVVSADSTIGTNSVMIIWSDNHKNNRPSDEEATGKLLDEWAGRDLEGDRGVSVEKAFKKIVGKFDSGRIDISRLIYLFKQLNLDSGDNRLQDAIESLDKAKIGSVTFEAFKIWWNSQKYVYSLRRSDEIYNSSSFHESRVENPTFSLNNSARSNSSPLRASKASLLSSLSSNSGGSNRGTLLGVTTGTLPPLTTILEDKSFHEKLHIASAGYNARPRTAGGSINRSLNGSANQKSGDSTRSSKSTKQKDPIIVTTIAVPHEYNIKEFNSCLVSDLTPNRMYQFRMKHIGSRTSSALSYPLSVMTRPLKPSNPILLDVTATMVRIKWFPPKYGAFKFMVQLRQWDEAWVAAYYGQENCWTSTIMNPDTPYEVRVISINYLDLQSDPSDSVSFHTLPREVVKTKIPSFDFKVECAGDICVGDVILLTERLYLKGPETDNDKINYNTDGVGNLKMTEVELSARDKIIHRVAYGYDRVIISPKPVSDGSNGTYIGERTVAALVLRDNYRMMRDKIINHNQSNYTSDQTSSYKDSDFNKMKTFSPVHAKVGHLDYKTFRKLQIKNRKLWLEIIWQKSSSDACKLHEYKIGDVVVRNLSSIEQFEVLRCEWKENAEEMRKPLKEEWDLMSECFIDVSLS